MRDAKRHEGKTSAASVMLAFCTADGYLQGSSTISSPGNSTDGSSGACCKRIAQLLKNWLQVKSLALSGCNLGSEANSDELGLRTKA